MRQKAVVGARVSATGRGAERSPLDFYETPAWCVDELLAVGGFSDFGDGVILDAGCGTGAISARLPKRFPHHTIAGCDIEFRPEFFDRCPDALFFSGDFLKMVDFPKIAAVIMNPPFVIAQQFIEHALTLTQGPVCALLRLNFAAGQARAAWLRALAPSIYITPRRPSFTPDGATDSVDYAWFLFDGKARVRWLRTERTL